MTERGSVEEVLVGRLRRPWGRRGEMLVEVQTDWPEQRFEPGRRLTLRFLDGRREDAIVEAFVDRAKGATIKFRGVDGIDHAERLRDVELLAARDELEGMQGEGDEAWHYADLVGAAVVLETDGTRIGEVRDVVESGACDLAEVALDAGGEALVPLVPEICTALDVDARVLRIDPPRGLLDPGDALVADPEER